MVTGMSSGDQGAAAGGGARWTAVQEREGKREEVREGVELTRSMRSRPERGGSSGTAAMVLGLRRQKRRGTG